MQLPKLTLVPPKIQSGDLFPALELVISSQALEEAIAITDSREKRASNSPNLRYRSFSHCHESKVLLTLSSMFSRIWSQDWQLKGYPKAAVGEHRVALLLVERVNEWDRES